MTTKITLDPALVREVLGIENNIEPLKVEIDDNRLCYDYADGSNYGCTWGNINIHEFKDKVIKYLAGKGWDMIIYPNEIAVMLPIADPKSDGRPRMIFRIAEGFYPDKLSAELAAISFVWEQIQKEKKNDKNPLYRM